MIIIIQNFIHDKQKKNELFDYQSDNNMIDKTIFIQ